MSFQAGWNEPGKPPEETKTLFSKEAAISYMRQELMFDADFMRADHQAVSLTLNEAAEALNRFTPLPWRETLGAYEFWIEESC